MEFHMGGQAVLAHLRKKYRTLMEVATGLSRHINNSREYPTELRQGRLLSPGTFELELSRPSEMMRDITLLVDELFPGFHVYSEVFQ